MQRKQEAIAAVHRQQYQDMLKGMNTDKLDALRKKHEAELAGMKTAYAKSMGLGERKPKNQLAPETKNDTAFWAGFKKGLGLKDGEEIGQESAGAKGGGSMTEMVHRPGIGDPHPPEPSPPPMPAPPPVENEHEDMKRYEDGLESFYDTHEAWEKEVATGQETAENQKEWEMSADMYLRLMGTMESQLETCNNAIKFYETYAPYLPEFSEAYKEEYERAINSAAILNQRMDSLDKNYIDQSRKQILTYQTPDNVAVKASGDPQLITFIQNCSQYISNTEALSQLAENDFIESKITIRETGSESEEISVDDAYNYYIYSTISSEYQTNAGQSFALGTVLDHIPVAGQVYSLYEIGSAAFDEMPYDINFELYDKLGGTYTKTTFTVVFDYDYIGYGDGGKQIFEVTVYYGEPIISDDGQVIENPLSRIDFSPQ